MTDADILARLKRVEDREEIRVLAAQYARFVDDHDFDGLKSLWAPDARYSWKDSPDVAVSGADVTRLLQSRIEKNGPSYHVNHDHVIEFGEDPDRASGLVCAHAETSGPGGQYVSAIRYHDRYLRHEGRWTFAERALAFLYFTPVNQYQDIMLAKHRIRLPNGTTQPGHWPDFAWGSE